MCGIWQDTAGYSGIQLDNSGIWVIQRHTAGYSGIKRDTAGYSGTQRDTAGYHQNILQSTDAVYISLYVLRQLLQLSAGGTDGSMHICARHLHSVSYTAVAYTCMLQACAACVYLSVSVYV